MQTYHILNGDCLAEQLQQTNINKDFIVCRECLIEGDVFAENITEFWKTRAKYMANNYNVSNKDYYSKSVIEFEKLYNIPDNAEVCLWFENDLFCQINMWFVTSMLVHYPTLKIYRIFPIIENENNIWKGFSIANHEQLERAYYSKIQFTHKDLELGKNLWIAYQNNNFNTMKELSKSSTDCFEYLEEVCQAHIERFPLDNSLSRPDKIVKEIIDTISTEFQVVFTEFSRREGIYGLSDLQIKNVLKKLIHNY
ncbi:MAG: DUF1835 domain-containing protein [Alphaproteobacteria bacterium]|nr:DUF1835 domain-containing protein [Alphaproteobacteria bacterium]